MASFMEARESAREAKKTLFYVQAVDIIKNFTAPTPTAATDLFHSVLQVPSLTKTKRLPAFSLLHVGMEVRLLTTLENPWAVQDATATVLEIHWAEHDAKAQQYMSSVAQDAEILLEQLPRAVLIRLHDCKHVFLPCAPCSSCSAFSSLCPDCMAQREELEGVFAVQPLSRTWKYDGPELLGQYIHVSRRQLPLGPAKVLPLYSMQGMTAEPGLVAHWVLPSRLDRDIKWLICYVILSRVPSLKQLISIGLSDKIREIIEGGPPEGVVQTFSTLFAEKIERTHTAALEARRRLGWGCIALCTGGSAHLIEETAHFELVQGNFIVVHSILTFTVGQSFVRKTEQKFIVSIIPRIQHTNKHTNIQTYKHNNIQTFKHANKQT